MPKRKREDRESLDYIKKKIKKLERRLQKEHRRRSSSVLSLSDSVQLSANPQDDKHNESDNEIKGEPGPLTSVPCVDYPQVLEPSRPEINDCLTVEKEGQQTQELDEMILEILGTDPSSTTSFGKDIQKDLAIRFEFIATSGLNKELRKELLERYLPPANCKMIDAPSLNPEIKAAVNEAILKRDKAMHAKQKQVCSAIACLSEAITLLLSKNTKDPAILKLLTDAGRILCDSQHNDSVTRRNFILAVLKKELKDQMQLTSIDSLLFGQELAETLKTAKAINKSGAELKSVAPKSSTNKLKPQPTNNNLNWKAPAPNRRQPGPPRATESAPPRQQHAPSWRASSRPSNNRGRR